MQAQIEERGGGRSAERARRAQTRRRAFLVVAGACAFVLGAAIGGGCGASGGGGGSGDGGGGSRSPKADRPASTTTGVPTVSDFHEPVPILMYHAISPAPPGAALPDLFVPESEFEAEMKDLEKRGYNAVTLDQVFAAWTKGVPIARNPIVISFDDGLQSQYVGARPMLDQLGWPAVLNLEIAHLDSGDLTKQQVTNLVDSGWELDSHTFTHPDVTAAGVDLGHEIADSRAYLQHRFGVPVNFFCYPAGAYDATSIAAVKAAGYLGATTTNEGLASPGRPYELSRIRVEPGDGPGGLKAKLDAAGA